MFLAITDIDAPDETDSDDDTAAYRERVTAGARLAEGAALVAERIGAHAERLRRRERVGEAEGDDRGA